VTTSTPALILIVDDDYDFLEINRMILERAGYRVITAAEPQQALTKMAKEKPDLVITDLMMTSLDSGFSFARTIKEDPRYAGVPVILSTSVSSAMGLDFRPRSLEETAQMSVDAYFDKPLVPAKLLAKIDELLAARDAQATAGGGGSAAPPGGADPAGGAETG
jgi:CheY-like chemotaxis protein